MIIHLEGTVNSEMVDKLIEHYNKLEFINAETNLETLTIYFKSGGGENASASVIIDLINNNKENTILIAYDQILSNGFKIFFEVICPKRIVPHTIGMYHLTSHPNIIIYEGHTLETDPYIDFVKANMKGFNYLESVHKLVDFTEKELKDLKSNQDVWITEKRLNQMLKYNLKTK